MKIDFNVVIKCVQQHGEVFYCKITKYEEVEAHYNAEYDHWFDVRRCSSKGTSIYEKYEEDFIPVKYIRDIIYYNKPYDARSKFSDGRFLYEYSIHYASDKDMIKLKRFINKNFNESIPLIEKYSKKEFITIKTPVLEDYKVAPVRYLKSKGCLGFDYENLEDVKYPSSNNFIETQEEFISCYTIHDNTWFWSPTGTYVITKNTDNEYICRKLSLLYDKEFIPHEINKHTKELIHTDQDKVSLHYHTEDENRYHTKRYIKHYIKHYKDDIDKYLQGGALKVDLSVKVDGKFVRKIAKEVMDKLEAK